MELLGIAQVAGIQTGLDVLDVVDVLLGVSAEVVDVEFLQADDAVDLVDEVLPFGVLVAHDALDQVGECAFVLVVFDHAQARERAELEALRLLVRVVHEVADVQDQSQHVHQRHRIPQ